MPRRHHSLRKIKRRFGGGSRQLFTPANRRLVYRCYEAGIPSARRIAEMCGLDPSLLTYWLDQGKNPDNGAYYGFRQKIMRIEARREAELISIIEKSASGGYDVKETQIKITPRGKEVKKRTREAAPQWQAAAWRLERWLPDDYGQKPYDVNAESSPHDLALEIQKAAEALDSSVPDIFEEEETEE